MIGLGDKIIWWIGAIVLVSGGIALAGFLLWQALECGIKFFRVRRLILDFYADQLRKKRELATTTPLAEPKSFAPGRRGRT